MCGSPSCPAAGSVCRVTRFVVVCGTLLRIAAGQIEVAAEHRLVAFLPGRLALGRSRLARRTSRRSPSPTSSSVAPKRPPRDSGAGWPLRSSEVLTGANASMSATRLSTPAWPPIRLGHRSCGPLSFKRCPSGNRSQTRADPQSPCLRHADGRTRLADTSRVGPARGDRRAA